MSEADLRSVNTIPPRMLVKAGSVLIVPRSAKHDDVPGHLAENGQLNLQPEMVTRRGTVKAGKNDTVASIARRYRLSPDQVAEWNSVGASAAFKAGQRVIVYLPVRAARPAIRTRSPSAKRAVRPAAKSTVRRTAPAKRR
jgi:membrane-bound lytic murein transglycosylase D